MGCKNNTIGLVLGGGGKRAFVHIGLISTLEKENISIDYIAGTSTGALVGVYYSLCQDSSKLKAIAKKIVERINDNPIKIDFNFGEVTKENRYLLFRKLSDFIKKGYLLQTEIRKTCLND